MCVWWRYKSHTHICSCMSGFTHTHTHKSMHGHKRTTQTHSHTHRLCCVLIRLIHPSTQQWNSRMFSLPNSDVSSNRAPPRPVPIKKEKGWAEKRQTTRPAFLNTALCEDHLFTSSYKEAGSRLYATRPFAETAKAAKMRALVWNRLIYTSLVEVIIGKKKPTKDLQIYCERAYIFSGHAAPCATQKLSWG